MQIDLFTFVAQVVNFLILVALLKVLLYKRIVQAIDERKKQIAESMEEAEEKKKEAEKEAESYEQKRKEVQEEKEKVIAQAMEDAENKRKELLRDARGQVEENQKKWQESVLSQRKSFAADLRKRAGEEVCYISRKVLNELADEELEERVFKFFLERLQNLSNQEKKDFLENIGESKSLILKSAFEFPQKLKAETEKVLEEMWGEYPELDFKKAEDLICGIELDSGGRKVSWSVGSYLESLEESISGAFDRFESEESEEGRQEGGEGDKEEEAGKAKKSREKKTKKEGNGQKGKSSRKDKRNKENKD